MVTAVGPLPPPNNLHISVANFGSREFTFTWSPVFPDCSSILYIILASDCGNCPNNTTQTTATCTDVPIKDSVCIIEILTVLCASDVGNSSDASIPPQEGPDAYGECNNGVIVARGLRVEGDIYTSQLSITVSAGIAGKNISCVHESVNTRAETRQFSTTVLDLMTGRCPQC